MSELIPRLFVGVDWATEEHAVSAIEPDGSHERHRSFKHSGDGLRDLVQWLAKLSDGHLEQVAVAIEVPHGAVVETLLEHGVQVFSINPKQLDRFRDRYSPAGAKDDRRDAFVLADSLRTDASFTDSRTDERRCCFRRLHVQDPFVLELREWSRMRDELVKERTQHTNKFRDHLRRYFPQFLELVSEDLGKDWSLVLWERVPTPHDAKRIRAATVRKILREHRIRRLDAETVRKTLKQRPLTLAEGTEKAAVTHIRLVVERLKLVNTQIRRCDGTLKDLVKQSEARDDKEKEQHSDAEIFRSIPGIGTAVLATLLAEASQPIRERDYHTLRTLSGAAPVTSQTGKQRSGTRRKPHVAMRRACNPRLREACCYHWVRTAMQKDPASKQLYAAARARGHSHARALRGVADRLLKVACSMLRHCTLYDPQRRQATADRHAATKDSTREATK